MRVGVENVASNFLSSPGEMARFLDAVDHPWVGCYLDLGNALYTLNGYPENWCTALAGRIVAVHVKDVVKKAHTIVNCGQGDLPWAEVLPVLKECGYDGYLFVETPPGEGGIEAGLAAAAEGMQGSSPLCRTQSRRSGRCLCQIAKLPLQRRIPNWRNCDAG